MKTNADDADLFHTVFAELKHMGVKVPKVKKFKSGIPKQDKCTGKPNKKIFGVHLAEQEWIAGSEGLLPKFIAEATRYLLNYSKTEGLFRKAGSVARQRNLRAKLENGEDLEGSDANDVASLLKQWLRELPEPLIPHYLQDLFIRCLHLDNEGSRITASLLTSLLLPPDHLHTLRHLLCFLEKFASDSNENKMGTYNLALMMAPNIFVSGTEIADKNSNNLVPLHTTAIQLLIENADKIGEVPSSVSFHHLVQEGKSGSELDSSTDLLDFSPSKSRKKRKSGQLYDILTGIKKLVGQNATPGASLKMTPEKHCNTRVTALKSASKRKADPDQQASCAVKKPAINAENGVTVTPKTKDNGNFNSDCSSASRHSRRKSFGLLQRKGRKRQKSAKSGCEGKLSLASTHHQNRSSVDATGRDPAVQVSMTSNENNLESQSPLQCTFEDFLKSVNMKKSASDCYLTPNLRKFSKSPKPASVSQSRLQDKFLTTSPYWLRSDKTSETQKIEWVEHDNETKLSNIGKAELKATKAASPSKIFLTPRRSPQLKVDFNIISGVSENNKNDLKNSTPDKKQNSEDTFTCSLLSDSLYGLNNSARKRSFSTGSKLTRKAAITRQDAFILKSRNKTDSAENEVKNFENKTNKKDSRVYRNESVLSNVKANSSFADKGISVISLSRNGSRQGSLIRGRPNSVKTGLLSQSLKNKSVLPSLDINEIEEPLYKVGIDQDEINIPVQYAPMIKDQIQSVENSPKQDLSLVMKFDSFCISPNASTVNKDSMPKSQVSSGQKPRSSNNSVEKTQKLKRKLSLPMNLDVALDDAGRKIPKLRNSLEIVSTDFVSDCEQKNSDFEEPCAFDASGCFKMPAPSKETTFDFSNIEITMNDSCFKTPRQNPQRSPSSITWVSGTKFLGFCSPEEEESFNKRESIALILKNKSGHVQEKVSLYDNRVRDSIYCTRRVQSCSTPYIAFSTDRNCSRLERSPSSSSHMHLRDSRKNKNSQSHSKRCDSTNKRNHTKGKLKSQKSPVPPPPKFVVTDMDTPSPKINQPLKEVTNICLGLNESNNSQNNTPGKNEAPYLKQSPCNVDNNGNACQKHRKLKRNSFSGHSPHTFTKRVSRSESSPCRPRQNKKHSGFVQGSPHSPSLPIRK